jgi:heat shock 70kDa protein 1/2/6/8
MLGQAVALGAAVQAGMLEGSLPDMMVMDIWQAGLIRALAAQQLRDNPGVASQLQSFDPEDMDASESSEEEVICFLEWKP